MTAIGRDARCKSKLLLITYGHDSQELLCVLRFHSKTKSRELKKMNAGSFIGTLRGWNQTWNQTKQYKRKSVKTACECSDKPMCQKQVKATWCLSTDSSTYPNCRCHKICTHLCKIPTEYTIVQAVKKKRHTKVHGIFWLYSKSIKGGDIRLSINY